MNDWQVGDLAVCVDDAPCDCCGQKQAVRRGNVYTVAALIDDPVWGLYLKLSDIGEVPGASHGYLNIVDANCFRKIRPDEHEACEPEFVTLLKRTKQKEHA